jgi:hypothetical protein
MPFRCSHRHISHALAALAGALSLAACTGYGRELLDHSLPDTYFLPQPPARVWEVARSEATGHAGRVLVDDPQSRIFSWVSEIEQGSQLHTSLADPKLASRGGRVMAITLLHVQPAPGGCRLVIRAIYFPEARTSYGPSPSRGAFEQALLSQIIRRLASGG